jgi:uncharacterized membrane protein YidH (DUF202 family)
MKLSVLTFALLVTLAPMLFTLPARADVPSEPRPSAVLVLDVRHARDLDVERLREAVARETRREVILSTDARAAGIKERIVVEADAQKVMVRYEPSPVARELPIEKGEAQLQQIALMAENLTRPEAAEILAQLPRSPRPSAPAAPKADAAATDALAKDDEAYERLESTLRYHVEAERAPNLAMGVAALAIAGTAIPTGLYTRNHLDERLAGELLIGGGIGLAIGGVGNLIDLRTGSVALSRVHERLVKQRGTAPTWQVVASGERAWQEQADDARKLRRWIGAIGFGVGVAGVATGTAFALTASNSREDEGRASAGAILVGLGAANTLLGAYSWLSPSVDERIYEGYMRATRPSVTVRPTAAVLPGGAAMGVAGVF